MFNIGDKVYSLWEPEKVGYVIKIDTVSYPQPMITVRDENGNEYANYIQVFKLWEN